MERKPNANQMMVCNNVSNAFRNMAVFYRLGDHNHEIARAMENIEYGLKNEQKHVSDEIKQNLELTVSSITRLKYPIEDKIEDLKKLVNNIITISDQGNPEILKEIKANIAKLAESINKLQ